MDEDQIPLSKLKSESKDTSLVAAASSANSAESKPNDSLKSAWDTTLDQAESSSSSEPTKRFERKPCTATSNDVNSTVCTSESIAGTSADSSLSVVTASTSVTASKQSDGNSAIVAHNSVRVIQHAHRMVKADRPLNILGPCHPHLLTAAQRSPWTTRISKRYADPRLTLGAQGHCLINELKRSTSGEVLDLSAKRQKTIPSAHFTGDDDSQLKASDCGAIDLTMNHDKPLALVKVKTESSPALNSWDSKSWKPQDEPLNFSKVNKPAVTSTLTQPPPLLRKEFPVSSTSAPVKMERAPHSIQAPIPQYPVSAMAASAYLFTLPKPPSYSNASLYKERAPIGIAKTPEAPMGALQIDLTRDTNTTGASSSTRFLSPDNSRQQAMLNAKHSHSLPSPRLPNSTHSGASRLQEPPKYGEHHRRIESMYDVARHHSSNSLVDPRQAAEARHKMQASPSQSMSRIRDLSPNHMSRVRDMSPSHISRLREASPNQLPRIRDLSPNQMSRLRDLSPGHMSRLREAAASNQMSRFRETSPNQNSRLRSPQGAMPRSSDMLSSPNHHPSSHSPLQVPQHRQSGGPPSQLSPLLQKHSSINKMSETRAGPGREELMVSSKQTTPSISQMQSQVDLAHSMKPINASISQRRPDIPSASLQNASVAAHITNNIPLTVLEKSAQALNQTDMAQKRNRPSTQPSLYRPVATTMTQRTAPAAHHHKSSSVVPSQSQTLAFGSQPLSQVCVFLYCLI